MKFFEIHQPYYALIRAEIQEDAIREYVAVVADDDGILNGDIREVSRDYALVLYSRSFDKDGNLLPVEDVVNKINETGDPEILLIDVSFKDQSDSEREVE